MKLFYRKKGFSMLELVIIIMIMVILGGTMVGMFYESKERAKHAKAKQEVDAIATAIKTYYGTYGKLPGDESFSTISVLDELREKGFLPYDADYEDPWGRTGGNGYFTDGIPLSVKTVIIDIGNRKEITEQRLVVGYKGAGPDFEDRDDLYLFLKGSDERVMELQENFCNDTYGLSQAELFSLSDEDFLSLTGFNIIEAGLHLERMFLDYASSKLSENNGFSRYSVPIMTIVIETYVDIGY